MTTTLNAAQGLIEQLVKAPARLGGLESFLQANLAEDVQGTVGHKHGLDKAQTTEHLRVIWAMVSGGESRELDAIGEGRSACARLLLTQHRHDPAVSQRVHVRSEVVIEAALWIDLNADGKIQKLHLMGDLLTPAMVLGLRLARQPTAGVRVP